MRGSGRAFWSSCATPGCSCICAGRRPLTELLQASKCPLKMLSLAASSTEPPRMEQPQLETWCNNRVMLAAGAPHLYHRLPPRLPLPLHRPFPLTLQQYRLGRPLLARRRAPKLWRQRLRSWLRSLSVVFLVLRKLGQALRSQAVLVVRLALATLDSIGSWLQCHNRHSLLLYEVGLPSHTKRK